MMAIVQSTRTKNLRIFLDFLNNQKYLKGHGRVSKVAESISGKLAPRP
jgi:hypothetical protein